VQPFFSSRKTRQQLGERKTPALQKPAQQKPPRASALHWAGASASFVPSLLRLHAAHHPFAQKPWRSDVGSSFSRCMEVRICP